MSWQVLFVRRINCRIVQNEDNVKIKIPFFVLLHVCVHVRTGYLSIPGLDT